MEHKDHVNLLRAGVAERGGTWAELGSGAGAFTLALADLLGPGAHIYSIDKDASSLEQQARLLQIHFPAVKVDYRAADFTRPLNLPPLDGVLMANSLHFVRQKSVVLQLVQRYLRPGGHFLLVEYNADHGNWWAPYPLSYPTWEKLSRQEGLQDTRLLTTVPSRFLREMYAALSFSRG